MLLEEVYKRVVNFLNQGNFTYIIIGGIAAGTLGEPRVTGDVDVDILLDKNDISDFLEDAKKAGFKFDKKKCAKSARETGTFQISFGEFHVDLIIASIGLEKEAFKRKKIIKLYKIKAYFPTPEDLILLKVTAGRAMDIVDAERVAIRHSGSLDKSYLINWAERLSDKAHDLRIYNEVKRLLTF